jgi:hypothetical protein
MWRRRRGGGRRKRAGGVIVELFLLSVRLEYVQNMDAHHHMRARTRAHNEGARGDWLQETMRIVTSSSPTG